MRKQYMLSPNYEWAGFHCLFVSQLLGLKMNLPMAVVFVSGAKSPGSASQIRSHPASLPSGCCSRILCCPRGCIAMGGFWGWPRRRPFAFFCSDTYQGLMSPQCTVQADCPRKCSIEFGTGNNFVSKRSYLQK